MIRLYRQTPEGIERTTQVDAEAQYFDSIFWIDLLTPEPGEIKFVERLCGLEMPTYDEMREIEATSRLYTEDGARFMTTTVLSRVDTESPSLSEITFVLMGAKIITIRHSDSYSFRVFSHQLLRQKQISRDQVFTGLLETIVDRQAEYWNASARNWTVSPKTSSAGTNRKSNPTKGPPFPALCASSSRTSAGWATS